MLNFSPQVQDLAESVSRRLVNDILSFVPEGDEAKEIGREIGGEVADRFEQAALPGIYNRSQLEDSSEETSEPPFFSPERYNQIIQGLDPSLTHDLEIFGVDPITLNTRRLARRAVPEERFLQLKERTVDPIAAGISEAAAGRIKDRVRNMVILGSVAGFVGGALFALGVKKLYDS